MTFVHVVDNLRKYLTLVRQKVLLNNINLVQIEKFTDYFTLSNNVSFDK